MKFGIVLPTIGPMITPESQRRLVEAVDRMGFDMAWTGDHVVLPAEIPAEYPFSPDGEPPEIIDSSSDVYESITTISHYTGVVDDLVFGTYACIAPLRNPLLLTKQVLSLHALSDGRFHIGVTPGWLDTEYESMNVPFRERGSRADEFLDIFHRACEEGQFAFDGTHHSFEETGFYPQPDDTPTVWVAGVSGASFRRVAEYGDGWLGIWDRPSEVSDRRKRLMRAWADFDRAGQPEIAMYRPFRMTDDEGGRPLVGTPESIRQDVNAYEKAGVTHLVVTPFADGIDRQIAELERFGNEIVATRS